MRIREEKEADKVAIRALNIAAFGTPAESGLVEALREQARPVISIVAEEGAAIVGHIMFSPVALPGYPELRIMGLAPMAVLPEQQRKGIGSVLVRTGLERCRRLGFGAVVVLGHPEYYPRFGFSPAARFGLGCDYRVPEEAFMAMELQPGYLHDAAGTINYHAAFSNV
jgi:putative acetyltransferase